jgi:hypothetical protein
MPTAYVERGCRVMAAQEEIFLIGAELAELQAKK